jgi:thiamine-phosphate pyrophosphorylase
VSSVISTEHARRRARLGGMRLYVITAESGGPDETARVMAAALAGGADVVQLRKKRMSTGDQYRLALSLRVLTRAHGALLIINDHADIAIAAGADGVHLGQDDLEPQTVRGMPGFEGLLIGRSTHSLEQARRAVEEGADYLGVGPVHATPTKPGRLPVGVDLVREVAAAVAVPFVAIGGIDATTVGPVIDAGARAVAVVRAVSEAEDPAAAVRELLREIAARLEIRV